MNKKVLSITLTLCMVLLTGASGRAAEPNSSNLLNSKVQILKEMNNLSGNKLKTYFDETQGKVFLSGSLSSKAMTSEKDVLKFVSENKAIFGLDKAEGNFKVTKTEKDSLGFTHVTLAQLIDGLPIKDKEITIHYDKNGIIKNITADVEKNIKSFTSVKRNEITKEEAIKIAEKEVNYTKLAYEPKVNLIAYLKDGKAYKTYKVNVKVSEPQILNYDFYVDVSSGNIIDKEDRIRYDGPSTGSGTAVDGSTKPINLYLSGSSYQMKDTTKPMTGQIVTYTANNQETQPGNMVTNTTNTFTTESYKAAVSAHYYGGVVYDFYKNLFNRNSLDNNGMGLISTVHYGNSYNNAFWDGTQMVYGDGDGTEFTYFSGDLDVVGHEMTHGVTEHTANLNYSNQSGALNESMSDVLGVLVQTYDKYNVKNGGTWTFNSSDWVVGDGIYTPGTPGDALRSLANPTLYNQPDNMNDYVNTSSDSGGVHTNSGIPNKAGYLLAQSIGCAEAAQIYYRALTVYMTSTTDFQGARNALVQAATDLYGAGSAEVTAVNTAYNTIGVGGSTPVTDPYEPNDTLSTAYAITKGTVYNAYISSSTDVDYYKFTQSSTGYINISLTNLPKDYDLYLYNSSGTQVAKSTKGGTSSESIKYNATRTGTYYVKIIGYNGNYSTSTKYALKVY
jgi:bacillolysin